MTEEKTNHNKIKEKINYLSKTISHHNKLYYEKNSPIISDYEYDRLFQEINKLKNDYPHLFKNNPLVENVGGEPNRQFESIDHPSPMFSLNNVMNKEEFINFIHKTLNYIKVNQTDYSTALKFDGLAIEIIYENGYLQTISTRGNGFVGENVTHNLKLIKNIPTKLSHSIRLIVRGEIILFKKKFTEINNNRKKNDLPLFSNPRNVAAGIIRQLKQDPNHIFTQDPPLHFYAYQLENYQEVEKKLSLDLSSYIRQINLLKELTFDVNTHTKHFKEISKIIDYYDFFSKERESLEYEIDGIVIQFNQMNHQNLLSVVNRRPRYAIAWKFPPLIKNTILEDIEFQVGRTGVITPVGILKPINLSGVIVKRVTLHNESEIIRKDLHLGDTVEVIRSGDVIPKIVNNLTSHRKKESQKINFPSHCPVCHEPLMKTNEGNAIFHHCLNKKCSAQIHQNIMHFCSKPAMNIEGFDDKTIKELLSLKLIQSVSDIYSLNPEDFDQLERMGDKKKSNLLQAIESSKKTSLSRFVYALGIHGIGQKMASILANKFKNINNFFDLTQEKLLEIDGIGTSNSHSILLFFNDKNNIQLIKELIQKKVIITHEDVQKKGYFNELKIIFTGSLSIPRNIAKDHITRLGGENVNTISQKTSLLIYGEKPGSKLKKALDLNIKIMTEKEFLKIISNENSMIE